MGTMLRTTWAQLDSTTLSEFSGELVDNITTNQIILWLMSQMDGVVYRQGITIKEPLVIEDNASVQWYSGYDPLSMQNNEGITMAEYAYKQLSGVMQLSGFEQWANEGNGQVIDLWNAKGEQLGLTMKRTLNTALLSDGSAGGGKAVVGVQAAVEFGAPWSVYGTIDSSLVPNWRNYYANGNNFNDATNGSNNVFNGLRNMILSTTAGNDRPSLVVMTQPLYQVFLSGLEAKQQITRGVGRESEALANAGFESTIYMGVPHVWDTDMQPASTASQGSGNQSDTAGHGAVALNLKYARFVFGEGMDFTFGEPTSPDNQDSSSVKCLMYGNFTLRNRRRQGRVNFADAA